MHILLYRCSTEQLRCVWKGRSFHTIIGQTILFNHVRSFNISVIKKTNFLHIYYIVTNSIPCIMRRKCLLIVLLSYKSWKRRNRVNRKVNTNLIKLTFRCRPYHKHDISVRSIFRMSYQIQIQIKSKQIKSRPPEVPTTKCEIAHLQLHMTLHLNTRQIVTCMLNQSKSI